MGYRLVCVLVVRWKAKECCGAENGAHLPFLDYFEGEDLERSLEDILSFFFHTLYLWIAAFLSPLMISYDDFVVRFSLSSYVSPLVYSRYT